ncbi:hypothetical protein [Flectobacillus sp. BAB-3569]|uniref:hypothetical protein n=1 Tax=Flectobacillus sp. BAB-3569 TaxID=1509483 RepID=UPI000BA456D2|nr:hypothetical protein [Flectobacillus sp. BAB-3569]PAC27837.1 hypothetical protein BWI92_21740 [Flectobacillus sp. BAB-3569]
MTTISATKIQRGMILENPHKSKGYIHKGLHFVPSLRVIKITKNRIILHDFSSIPKIDENGKEIIYSISE